jgi:hypothetical protein
MERKTLKKIKRSHLLPALAILAFYSLFMVVSACDSSTSPKTGTLTGRVELVNDTGNPELDPADYSGVTIALYELAKPDTIVTNAMAAFPSVGFPIDQNSEFDHRLNVRIAETTSDASGAFVLSKVPYGTYNLVILKSGWGFRYKYSIIIDGESSSVPIDDLILYPERVVSGYFQGTLVLDDWRHLLVPDDVLISPESSLSLGSNAVVRINPGKKIDIMGGLHASASHGSMFRVTSNDGLFLTHKRASQDILPYHSINLLGTSIVDGGMISNGMFSFATIGLSSQLQHALNVNNCSFLSREYGFWASASSPAIAAYSIFKSIATANNGISFYAGGGGDITRNLILSAKTGIRCEANSNPPITNNVIINSESGIELFDSSSEVRYNYIRNSNIGIRTAGSFAPIVSYNHVSARRAVTIGYNGYFAHSKAVFNYNNLEAIDYYYYVISSNSHDIDAKHNYHNTTDYSDIEDKTYHKPDYPESQQNQVAYVVFNPYAFQPISNAGVQP